MAGNASARKVLFSRRIDLICFLLGLAILLSASPWLRVYYRITAVETQLVQIESDGERHVLDEPPQLALSDYWNLEPEDVLGRAQISFAELMLQPEWVALREQGASYEWTVRYSYNSPALDQSRVFRADAGGPR